MPTLTAVATSLDWSETLESLVIECAGEAFLEYQSLREQGDDFSLGSDDDGEEDDDSQDDDKEDTLPEDTSPEIDLFSLDEKGLEDLDYYKTLHMPFSARLTPDDVKKFYRKACLKYHPDKSGRGEEDAVFLKVKAAFDVLSTQKVAYDSTEMPFDESLPDADTDQFYHDFGHCFERNLHFDARLLPQTKKNRNKRKSRKNKMHHSKPPLLGDENTPVNRVHGFYDYWAHFESWRDFGLQASRELEACDQIENAESRYEKRWYQKEIDKRAKKLKQQEQARITTLLERAMAADPRLQKERKRLLEEKEEKQRQRILAQEEKKRQEEAAKFAEQQRMKQEEEKKKEEKLQREKEKKLFRKTKQVFRKYVSEALASLLEPEHALEDEVDIICTELDREQLIKLNSNLESKSSPAEVLELVRKRATNLQNKVAQEKAAAASAAKETEVSIKTPTVSKIPFTKEEMSVLAKGVKKYPAGGGNRWDQIALYINNVCRPETPRTKEECIENFNKNKVQKPTNGTKATSEPASAANGGNLSQEDTWTEDQDKLLQASLSKFPATMDKNERWTNIAKAVPGKTKKQCVQRFKAIRDALKNKK